MRSISFLVFALCLTACEKPMADEAQGGKPTVENPGGDGSGEALPDTLIAVNDTARFYISASEICNVTLADYPTPSVLIKTPRYRLPRRLEVAAVLSHAAIPDGYHNSQQRILCYDAPEDAGQRQGNTNFGTGFYYTFTPNGNITRAGYQTKYCILPMRTEPLEQQGVDISITINDSWDYAESD